MKQDAEAWPRVLPSLTSLRAFAALLVFVFHLGRWDVFAVPFFQIGDTGVAFFFILSGFLLSLAFESGSTRRFYARRGIRVYPSHAVVWLIALVVPVTVGQFGLQEAAASLLLIQAWIPGYEYAVNGVAWSLSCEIAFYALFPLLMLFVSRLRGGAVWLLAGGLLALEGVCATVAALEVVSPALGSLAYTHPLVRLPEFVLGIAGATAMKRGWTPTKLDLLMVVAVAAIGLALCPERPARNVWLAPMFLLFICLAAQRDRRGGEHWLTSRVLVYAGKLSFPFYLVHELVIINLAPHMDRGMVLMVTSFALAVAAAAAVHHGVEVPAQARLATMIRVTRRAPPSDPVGT